jgi:hypothetical protein
VKLKEGSVKEFSMERKLSRNHENGIMRFLLPLENQLVGKKRI